MTLYKSRKQFCKKLASKEEQRGFSSNEMVVVISCIGILATISFPIWIPTIEMAELLIAEKYLLGAVRECQTGLVNGESYPLYTVPPQSVGIDFITKRRFQFSNSGEDNECLSPENGNILTTSRISGSQRVSIYNLNINVVTGEKTSEGNLPSWLDWWEGFFSPIIPENDPLLP